ncbi:hypothetical protein M2271_005449 [Streptomyces sp. LBL]|uniref:hypothetical protein n=1 Tax=Streptomyces sp. LBL TaxID=2940562 RepID=UPI00247565D3|nr:hypothetical protein [Streptomyces sp. LBL]MDH6627622.1 hypothetical protein [Streptomyces sp. LBL]
MAEQNSTQNLPQPLRAAASVLRKVPGAGTVGRAAEGALDKVGAVSPRGRRLAVYTGAGVLGVAGVVEWPVAVTGAAVAWLTQPRQPETVTDRKPEVEGAEGAEGTEAVGGSAGESEGAGASGGKAPTPQVLASSTPSSRGRTATPDTPSDKLPTHHADHAAPGRHDGTSG